MTAPRPPGMPTPMPLPAEPAAAAHLRNPAVFFDTLAQYDESASLPASLTFAAERIGGGLERALVPHLDPQRAINAAVVDGQLVAELPIARERVAVVKRMLASYSPIGGFGAVALPPAAAAGGSKVAWLDERRATIALGNDLRGIATAGVLAGTYGKQPLHLTISAAQAKRYGIDLPVSRVSVRGMGPHAFTLTTVGVPRNIPQLALLADGAFTELMHSSQLVWAASSRYAPHRQKVAELLRDVDRQVARQNFFVRGNLQDLAKRARRVLESWNGRVFVGLGAEEHLLVGLGTDRTAQSEKATLSLVSGLLDNVQLAQTFGLGSGVPNLRFARRKAVVDGQELHVIALEQARKWIPSELHRLINGRGELRVAFSFAPRTGALLAAMGPSAPDVLTRWVAELGRGKAKAATPEATLALMFAAPPSALASALRSGNLAALLGLRRSQEPMHAVLQRDAKGLQLEVKATPIRRSAPVNPRRRAAARSSR